MQLKLKECLLRSLLNRLKVFHNRGMLVGHVLLFVGDKAHGGDVEIFEVILKCKKIIVLIVHTPMTNYISPLKQICTFRWTHALYSQIPWLAVIQTLDFVDLNLLKCILSLSRGKYEIFLLQCLVE